MRIALFWFFALFSALALYAHPELWVIAAAVAAGIMATRFVIYGINT